MSVVSFSRPVEAVLPYSTTRAPWRRVIVLGILLALSLASTAWLASRSPLDALSIDVNNPVLVRSMLVPYGLSFLPYLLACALVLTTRPVEGRWRWLELVLILGGAALLRGLVLPLPPNLSRDSWRYVWDARVSLHGYSPYVYAPGSATLQSLRNSIFANSRYRNVPTLYPPGAQYIYILSYLLAPDNLFVLKGIFIVCDLASCALLVALLVRKGLDPARVVLYAWSPLSIVEFALQGHMDVLPIVFMLLAALMAGDPSRNGRILTGLLIGLATLMKIYPILMLVPVVKLRTWKRDALLVLTCLLTIVIGYLPFFIQGHGQIFGFFSGYANQQESSAGFVQLFIAWLGSQRHLPLALVVAQEHFMAFLLLAGLAAIVFILRQRERISLETGILLLFGLILAVSSHVFPWYTPMLLPWIALLWPARQTRLTWPLLVARWIALGAPVLFSYVSIVGYLQMPLTFYYLLTYDSLVIALLLAALFAAGSVMLSCWQKGLFYAKRSNIK